MRGKAVFKPFIYINDVSNNATSYMTNAMLGSSMGDIINLGQRDNLPEYDYMKSEYNETLRNFSEEYPSLKCEKFNIEVDKKTSLQTIDIKNVNNKENNYLVVFMGNGEMLEGRIRRLAKMSKDFNCDIRSFNYRGKGDSTGSANKADDLVADGKAQVEDLLKSGIDPKKITLYGKCMGAAIGVLIAQELHGNSRKVKVALDLPFSKLSSMYLGMLRLQKIPNNNVDHLKRKKMLLKIYKPFVKKTFKSSKWEMDIIKAYKSIPEEYKMFFQIRSRNQEERNQSLFGDGVISDEASLGYALEKELLQEQERLKSKTSKLEKKIIDFQFKTHKNKKNIEEIKSFKIKNSEFKNRINRINDELFELKKTEIKKDENPLNEDYNSLNNKQNSIKLIRKLDDILPRVLDIVRELGEMKAPVLEDKNIDAVQDLNRKYGEKRAEIERSLVDISYELRNEKRKPNDPDQIEDIDTFAVGMAEALLNTLVNTVRFVMDMPELRVSECLNVLVENNGLVKLGHNKDLKDLHYLCEDITADIALNRFINKPIYTEKLRSKSISNEAKLDIGCGK